MISQDPPRGLVHCKARSTEHPDARDDDAAFVLGDLGINEFVTMVSEPP